MVAVTLFVMVWGPGSLERTKCKLDHGQGLMDTVLRKGIIECQGMIRGVWQSWKHEGVTLHSDLMSLYHDCGRAPACSRLIFRSY